jgi:hypothetical protein
MSILVIHHTKSYQRPHGKKQNDDGPPRQQWMLFKNLHRFTFFVLSRRFFVSKALCSFFVRRR